MGIIAWIILGGIAGWIASIIAGNNSSQGIIGNILVGIAGAFVGGLLFRFFGGEGVTGFDLRSFVVAIVGATLLLFIFRGFRRA